VGRGNAGRGNGGGNSGEDNGNAGGRGRGNAGGVGRGNQGEGRGNAGNEPEENGGGGRGRGNAGRGGGGSNADDEQGEEGGQGRGRGGRGNGDSFVDRMNPNLRARLEAMLPSGMTLEEAAEGFRNQGQFIAALQQSKNHDLSFSDLKSEMTGDNPLSLGQAMRKLGVETDED
jgi:hypothetical protein